MQQKVAAAGAECGQGMPRLIRAVEHSGQADVGELGLAGLDQGVEPRRSGGTGGAGDAQYSQGMVEGGRGFEGGAQVADAVDEDRGGNRQGWELSRSQWKPPFTGLFWIMARLAAHRPILSGVKSRNGHRRIDAQDKT